MGKNNRGWARMRCLRMRHWRTGGGPSWAVARSRCLTGSASSRTVSSSPCPVLGLEWIPFSSRGSKVQSWDAEQARRRRDVLTQTRQHRRSPPAAVRHERLLLGQGRRDSREVAFAPESGSGVPGSPRGPGRCF